MPKNNAAKKGKKVGNKGKEPMGKKDKVAEQPKVRLFITTQGSMDHWYSVDLTFRIPIHILFHR